MVLSPVVKLLPNRVRRNYLGGRSIDTMQGVLNPSDSDKPEEWIGSLIPAKNYGLPEIENEGYSKFENNGKEELLKTLIVQNPEYYLSKNYYQKKGLDFGFLFKILDSSMRLHVQVHPTASFAQQYLDSQYGKMECYYILKVREGTDPYIRLGFQHLPTKNEWKRIIEEQDIKAMDDCFEKVPIKKGEVLYIPGGVPHAIGENVMLLEIMEPSDLVVRCEYERNGIIVPPKARFMNKTLDFCLNIFEYKERSLKIVEQTYKVEPVILQQNENYTYKQLIDYSISKSFSVYHLDLKNGTFKLDKESLFMVAVVIVGKVSIATINSKDISLTSGESVFLAANSGIVNITTLEKKCEICFVSPIY